MDHGICLFRIEMQSKNTKMAISLEQSDLILKKLLIQHLIFHLQYPHRNSLKSIVFIKFK